MRANPKWLLVGLLFLATTLCYLDRQTLSVSATPIVKEMGLDDGDLGQLFFAFFISYGVAQIFVGGFLDRLSVRIAFPAAVIAWSLAGAAAALATGFWSLFALRVLLGIFESPNWPLALRMTSKIFPPSERSFVNGLFHCGSSVGAIIAPPIIIYLTITYNWRVAFVVIGALGLVWAGLWAIWLRVQRPARLVEQSDPLLVGAVASLPQPMTANSGAGLARPEDAASPATLAEILRAPAFWGLLIATCFVNPLQHFYIAWLPRYFDTYAGVGFGAELARRLVLAYLALDVGLIGGGGIVSLMSRRMRVVVARRWVTTVGACCMACVPLVSRMTTVNGITVVICVATFGLGCFMVNYLTFASEVSAKKASTATGILGGAGALAGATFMLIVGNKVLKDQNFAAVFVFAGIMPLIGLAGIWFATTFRARGQAG